MSNDSDDAKLPPAMAALIPHGPNDKLIMGWPRCAPTEEELGIAAPKPPPPPPKLPLWGPTIFFQVLPWNQDGSKGTCLLGAALHNDGQNLWLDVTLIRRTLRIVLARRGCSAALPQAR